MGQYFSFFFVEQFNVIRFTERGGCIRNIILHLENESYYISLYTKLIILYTNCILKSQKDNEIYQIHTMKFFYYSVTRHANINLFQYSQQQKIIFPKNVIVIMSLLMSLSCFLKVERCNVSSTQ